MDTTIVDAFEALDRVQRGPKTLRAAVLVTIVPLVNGDVQSVAVDTTKYPSSVITKIRNELTEKHYRVEEGRNCLFVSF
jgi:hypothetical protein